MYVGRPLPHKNLERLIEAFVKIKATHPDVVLVLAGKKDPVYRQIESDVARRTIKNVIFTDYVTEGRLRWLYENCSAYVFPSLSEGFGLPGLEAMIHGAPVVSSNATCLPEVYGDAAHYFDPTDIQAMADAINEVLTDKDLRLKLTKSGHDQAAKYSWEQTAAQTLAIYNQVLGE
jgi:glycosyltransferase involved in cell wall biosynthesis